MEKWTRKTGAAQFVLHRWENAYCQWKGHPHGYVVRSGTRGGAIIGKGMSPDAAWINSATYLLNSSDFGPPAARGKG